MFTGNHHRFTRIIVDCSNPIGTLILSVCWNLYLLSTQHPHLTQCWKETQVDFIPIIKVILWCYRVSCCFDLFFLTTYSGSGLETLCWGRLNEIPCARRWVLIVSSETVICVFSFK